MKLHVNVTQNHIDRGKRCNSERCPVALSILEVLPEVSYVAVDERIYVELSDSGDYIKADTPDEVCSFARAFDKGKLVKPFSFEVELV
jgi:hypothetical protein